MIDINLLPEEFRVVEGTPKPRLVASYLCVAITLILLALLGIQYFAYEAELANNEQLIERKGQLEKKAEEYDDVQREIGQLSKRRDVIATLLQQRLVWSPKLDQLIDLVPDYVQFGRITLRKPEETRGKGRAKTAPQGKLILSCRSNSEDPRFVSSFYRVLLGERPPDSGEIERSLAFARDFVSLGHDGGKLVELEVDETAADAGEEPPEGWEFNITLLYERPQVEKPAAAPEKPKKRTKE